MLRRNTSWVYLCSTSNIKLGFTACINYISHKTMGLCSGLKIHFHSILASWVFCCCCFCFSLKPQEERMNLRVLNFPNLSLVYHFSQYSKIHIYSFSHVTRRIIVVYLCPVLQLNLLWVQMGHTVAKVNQYCNSIF